MSMKVIRMRASDLSAFRGSNLVPRSTYQGYSLILVPRNFGYGDQLFRGSRSSCEKFLSYMEDTQHGTSKKHFLDIQELCYAQEDEVVKNHTVTLTEIHLSPFSLDFGISFSF